MKIFEEILIFALCLSFIYRLAAKWRLFEKWDTYLPIKRCMFCLSWWIGILFFYLLMNGLDSPFDLDFKDCIEIIIKAMVSTSLTLLVYENSK